MNSFQLFGSDRWRRVAGPGLGIAGAALAVSVTVAQSLSYSSGQNVSPAFEGWETDAQGNSFFMFGYMNNNWDEEIDVPPGPDNGFSLGADMGQPTHFLPRRNRFVFKVPVPKDFGTRELVWTLKTNGVTEKAYATLRQDYFVDNVVIASETGALGAGSSNPAIRANKPPLVQIPGELSRAVKVGQPLPLVAMVTDDGVPRAPGQNGVPMPNPAAVARRVMMPPQRITVGKSVGLHVSWFVYRGSGAVQFDPPQIKPWEDTRNGANSPWAPLWFPPPVPADGKYATTVTFAEPARMSSGRAPMMARCSGIRN
ncbi:MAG TPA: hypothetical protein VM032_18340 [Vicinamibacterales bacterium]|nr:hypothetical protein [Vicinamibacterales bacterium]